MSKSRFLKMRALPNEFFEPCISLNINAKQNPQYLSNALFMLYTLKSKEIDFNQNSTPAKWICALRVGNPRRMYENRALPLLRLSKTTKLCIYIYEYIQIFVVFASGKRGKASFSYIRRALLTGKTRFHFGELNFGFNRFLWTLTYRALK